MPILYTAVRSTATHNLTELQYHKPTFTSSTKSNKFYFHNQKLSISLSRKNDVVPQHDNNNTNTNIRLSSCNLKRGCAVYCAAPAYYPHSPCIGNSVAWPAFRNGGAISIFNQRLAQCHSKTHAEHTYQMLLYCVYNRWQYLFGL